MLTINLFGREGCHLCDEAIQDLNSLRDKYPHQLTIIDVDEDPDLWKKFGEEVPVITAGPYTLRAPFDKKTLEVTLGAASDRIRRIEEVEGDAYNDRVKRAGEISRIDRFSMWFAKHYMIVFNFIFFAYVGLPVLAPVLLKAGIEAPANLIYRIYGGLCHQLSYRSWFLFGEQPIYPRELAGIKGFLTFSQATGLDEHGLVEARQFLGSDFIGYKIALCQRDVAIYGAILLFGILFVILRKKIKPLPFWAWIIIGIAPIGFDGFSQVLGQLIADPAFDFLRPVLGFIPFRESTPFLRTLTGFLFGFTTAWFGYPLVEEAMHETRSMLTTKFIRIEGSG